MTAETVRPIIVKHVSRASALMTDESNVYTKLGREFTSHQKVDHSRDEYAYFDKISGHTVSINISENFYSIFKRGINRSKLGVEDDERAAKALKGIEGKRLTYDQPRQSAAAN